MNDLIKVNTMSENMALNKCQEILNDRREALASKAKKKRLSLYNFSVQETRFFLEEIISE